MVASTLTAALPAFAANLALELAPVRVNVIAAGFVDTPLSASLFAYRFRMVCQNKTAGWRTLRALYSLAFENLGVVLL